MNFLGKTSIPLLMRCFQSNQVHQNVHFFNAMKGYSTRHNSLLQTRWIPNSQPILRSPFFFRMYSQEPLPKSDSSTPSSSSSSSPSPPEEANPWAASSRSAEEMYGLVDDSKSKPPPSGMVAVKEKVKEASYFVVGLVGCVFALAVVGGGLYVVFSPNSPQALANKAASKVKQSPAVMELLGTEGGIQTYGFGSRRRNLYPLREFKNVSGEDTRVSTFFMRGSQNEAEVTAQWVKRDGSWLFEFLHVEIVGHRKIVLIANCHEYLN